ncbi:MAG: DMT family transporter [Candidatus Eremiobacteraeota bacterium]|nr:DMT family transporter [Candidatus Eremiobacteraeota bacterium]
MKVPRGPGGAAITVFYIFLWASAYVPSKIASIESQPFWFLAVRFATAGAVLALVAVVVRAPFPKTVLGWVVGCSLGILANALYLGLTYLALHRLSSGMGAIVASTNPLVLAAIAPFALGERLSLFKSFGLLLGFGGVLAIVLARSSSGGAAWPDVSLAFGGVCASVASTVLYKRLGTNENLLALSAIQLCTAGLVLVPFAALSSGPPHVHLTPELVAAFWYLVLVLSIGATLLWFWLLTHGEASRVSAYYYLTPAFGLALSAIVLHEPLAAHDAFGLAAIAAGIVLVQRG